MADLGNAYNATILTSTPVTLDVLADDDFTLFTIDATGAGSLQIETKADGQSAFNVATSISAESVILDLDGLEQIRLTASTANVPVSIRARTGRNLP